MQKLQTFLVENKQQILRFLCAGGAGAITEFASLYVLVDVLHVREELSFFLSAILSVIVVFLGNKFFTFKNSGAVGGQIAKFAVVYGISIVLNALLSNVLFAMGIYYLLAKAIAIGLIIVWNYSLSKWWVFANS
jgi:putative flippase GtrA